VREQMLPGNSDAFKDARARLFAAAMRVHLAFVCAAGPDLFDRNLRAALAMLQGRGEIQPIVQKAAEHLWATLALVTPVVSTTFASLSRGFAHMGAGSIPWLLVDEAGQAVPHQALGAIWRARRAVVVGDPFQVEPVMTMDRNVDAKLAERRGAPDRHRATLASTQTLADAANPFGAWVRPRAGRPVWVGCPLKVHRRCIKPMFGISNRLAYDGGMVLARGKMAEEYELTKLRPLLGESRWFDVAAKQGGPKHFIREQAEVVLRLVRAYAEQGFAGEDGLPALFVISPYRSMADGLRKALGDDLKTRGHAPKGCWRVGDGIGRHGAHLPGQGEGDGHPGSGWRQRRRHRVGMRHAEHPQRGRDPGAAPPIRGWRPGALDSCERLARGVCRFACRDGRQRHRG